MTCAALIFAEAFLEPGIPRDDVRDPWDAERLRVVWEAVRMALPEAPLIRPRPATEDELALVHDRTYIAAVRDYATGARSRVDDFRYVSAGTAIASNSYELASLAAGAVIAAVDALEGEEVSRAFVMARPADHHAFADRGEGFCIFNHTAIGARYVQQRYERANVLILDWDVHHGNGTQAIFSADPSVVTFSIHSFGGIYPRSGAATSRGTGAGQGTAINVPLEAGTTDRRFREAFLKALRRVRSRPDFIFVVAGFDAHREDPVGNLKLTDETFDWLTSQALGLAREWCDGRLVSVLAGGYNPATLGRLAAAHARALAATDAC